MRTLITFVSTISILFCTYEVNAQHVNRVNLSDITADYLEVVEYRPALSDKVCIRLDFGQKVINEIDDTLVKDDSGKSMNFDSALNFVNKMKAYGYELFQVAYVNNGGAGVQKYYILKKKLL